MDIIKKIDKDSQQIEISVSGRIDTATSGVLQSELLPTFADFKKIVLNLSKVNYVSSAGLRVLLAAQKESQHRNVDFEITGVIAEVKEIFDMTGFTKILNIK
jgi:anti-sigma B factor antagonist